MRGGGFDRAAGTPRARPRSRRRTRHSRARARAPRRMGVSSRRRADDVGIRLGAVEQACGGGATRRRPGLAPPVERLPVSAVEQLVLCRDSRSDGLGDIEVLWVWDSLDVHSKARRAPEPARCITWPVRRRIAPVEAPLTSRRPPSRSAPPMMAAPVSPMRAARVPPIAIPMKPPESLPSSVIRPRNPTPTPRRKGRTSRRSLRARSRPAECDERDGQDIQAALPTRSSSTSASHEPTAPPSRPR